MLVKIPSDKSISHRSIMFELFCDDLNARDYFIDLLPSADIQATRKCVDTIKENKTFVLDCENSGTTARLIMGILAGRKDRYTIIGDESLSQRPMKRVVDPLRELGCEIEYLKEEGYLPLSFKGCGELAGKVFSYDLKIASAQIKSALLFAGISTKSQIILTGKINSRDHTETMLMKSGVEIEITKSQIHLQAQQTVDSSKLHRQVPGDPSSAAFWILYGVLNSQNIEMDNICLSPSRMGFFNILKKSGVSLAWKNHDIGQIIYTPSSERISPFSMTKEMAASCIDELPILAVIACMIPGEHHFYGADELKVKESNRLEAIKVLVNALGASFKISGDCFSISTNKVASQLGNIQDLSETKDHRIVMIIAILKVCLFTPQKIDIKYPQVVEVSYPNFWKQLDLMNRE